MFKKLTNNLPSSSTLSLTTARVILFMSPIAVLVFRNTDPNPETFTLFSTIIGWIIIVHGFASLSLSFVSPFVSKNLYYFLIAAFCLHAIDSAYNLHIYSFSEKVQGDYLLLTFLAVIFLRRRDHLLIVELYFACLLIISYFLTPGLGEDEQGFTLRYGLALFGLFLLLGSRITALEKLVYQDLEYKDLLERLNEGVLQLDSKDIIQVVNEQFCQMVGYEREELLGQFSIYKLIPEEDKKMLYQKLADRKSGKTGRYEIRLIRKDGAIIWARVSAAPNYDRLGTFTGATSILQDITDQKRSEMEIDNYAQVLKYTNNELELKNQELEQFAAMASSDLKAPMEEIIKSSELLEQIRTTYDPLSDEYVQKINQSAHRMKDLLDALMLYSISSVKQMKKQAVQLNDLLMEVSNNLAVYLDMNHVSLVYDELPTVQADRVQMIRLFRNLVENAIKYRGEQPPVIHISHSESVENQEYIFSVEDNGIGIVREDYDKIFMIFQKNPNVESSGVGMGLAICKKIVVNHGGRLWFTSNAGKGTTFYFSLPINGFEDHAQEDQIKENRTSTI